MGERRAATAGVPGRPGHRRWRGLAGPGLPGRRPPLPAHWTGARRGRPVCGGQGRLTLAVARRAAWTACRRPGPGARRRIEVAVAWRRARELGRLRRGISRRRGRGPDALAPGPGPRPPLVRAPCPSRCPRPGPGGMRYRARHLTIARCRPRWRPAAGGRSDAIPVARLPAPGPPGRGRGTGGRHLRFHRHGQVGLSPRHRRAARDRPRDRPRSCGDGPSGLGPVRHRLMSGCAVTGAGLSGVRFPWLPGARDLTGWPRGTPGHPRGGPHGLAEWLAGRQCGPCGQPLVPTGCRSPVRIFSNHGVLAGAPLRNRTVDLLLTMDI